METASPPAVPLPLLLRRLETELPRFNYRFVQEKDLHDGVARVLDGAAVTYRREHVSGSDRFDFLVDGGVAIEVKCDGSYADALRQAERYTHNAEVGAVVLLTTKRWCSANPARGTLNKKPLVVVQIRRVTF